MRIRNQLRVIIFILLASVFSCRSGETIPDNVLPPEKMEKILWDMVRADQLVTDYILPKDTSLKPEIESIRMYQQVFRIHQVSREEFQRSLDFYKTHPDFLKPVVDSIIATVNTAPTERIKETQ